MLAALESNLAQCAVSRPLALHSDRANNETMENHNHPGQSGDSIKWQGGGPNLDQAALSAGLERDIWADSSHRAAGADCAHSSPVGAELGQLFSKFTRQGNVMTDADWNTFGKIFLDFSSDPDQATKPREVLAHHHHRGTHQNTTRQRIFKRNRVRGLPHITGLGIHSQSLVGAKYRLTSPVAGPEERHGSTPPVGGSTAGHNCTSPTAGSNEKYGFTSPTSCPVARHRQAISKAE